MKKEFDSLKDSNENHIFINEKLNKALKRMEDRNEKLTEKLRQITNESVVLPKKNLQPEMKQKVDESNKPQITVGASRALENQEAVDDQNGTFGGEPEADDFFAGDVSSIMIKPDQIMHDQDLND